MCNKLSVKFQSQMCGCKILRKLLKPPRRKFQVKAIHTTHGHSLTSEAWEACAHIIQDYEGVMQGAGLIVGCSSWEPTLKLKNAKSVPCSKGDSLYLFIVRPFLLPFIHEKWNEKEKRKKR